MKRCLLAAVLALPTCALFFASPVSWAYVEAPHTLGRCCHESTNIVLVEVTRIDKAKNLLIYKKIEDLKGTHPQDQIKHNIGQRGFHEREWKNVMAWAEVGKRAVFFHNGGASETCIAGYWYQCYPEVVVPCLADGPREQLLLAKGKLQRLKASLKRIDYDAKRDFVGFGAGEGE